MAKRNHLKKNKINRVQTQVSPLPCFKISAPVLCYHRERGELYDLKSSQNILLTKKEIQASLPTILLTSFLQKKLGMKGSLQRSEHGFTL